MKIFNRQTENDLQQSQQTTNIKREIEMDI